MSKKVYRLEHKTVKKNDDVYMSPYQDLHLMPIKNFDNVTFKKLQYRLWNHSNNHRPSPQNDGLHLTFTKDYYCACPSLDKLKIWFNCIFDDIIKLNFVIRVYTVKDYINGNSNLQCIFHKDNIISKKTIKL